MAKNETKETEAESPAKGESAGKKSTEVDPVTAARAHMVAREEAAKQAKKAAESKNGRFPYTVSAGKSVTSRRGILAAGEGCTPMDFNADGALGAGAADEMWRKGYLLKDGQAHPDSKS